MEVTRKTKGLPKKERRSSMSRTEYDYNVVVENEEGDEIWDSGFGVFYTEEEAYQAGLAHLTCETDTFRSVGISAYGLFKDGRGKE